MALKFRRGTTAQQSGSLAFGEPYINTTLGTLVVGGQTGDIILSATGTGSTGNFGAISGSGLDITGNANIAGNLTLGGTITIGDSTTDNVVVNADLSSSLIPNNDNAFDLGSSTKTYRTIYGGIISGSVLEIMSGSNPEIRLINKTTGIEYHIQNGNGGHFQIHNGTTGTLLFKFLSGSIADGNQQAQFFDTLYVSKSISSPTITRLQESTASLNAFSASQITTESGQNLRLSRLEESTASLNSLTSSYAKTNTINTFVGDQTITGSLAINDSATNFLIEGNGFSQTYLTSNGAIVLNPGFGGVEMVGSYRTFKATDITAEGFVSGEIRANNGVVSGSAQVVSMLSSLNTYTGSNDTTNTTQNTRLTRLEESTASINLTTASLNGHVVDINTKTGSFETKFSTLQTYTASVDTKFGAVQASTSSLNTFTASNSNTSLNSYTASNDTTNTTQNTRLTRIEESTSSLNTLTASLATTYEGRATAAKTIFSGSAQVDHNATTNYVANKHIDHTTVSISAGNGLTGGGDISTTRTLTLDTTSATFTTGVTTQNNTLAVVSGSKTISGITLGSNLNTLTIGTGLSGTSYNGSAAVTIANTGVLSITSNTGLSSNVSATGNVTITNTGVTSITGTSNQVVASASTGGVTLSLPQSIHTAATPTFAGLTINGSINATGDITAYYTSDKRHKNNIQPISNALLKVSKLNGVTWEWNDDVHEVTKSTPKTGLIAQEVLEVLPEVVKEREDGFLALDYSKMMGLMVEAIKEQQTQIHNLTLEIENLKKVKGL